MMKDSTGSLRAGSASSLQAGSAGVIIPTVGSAKLSSCLASVLGQTHDETKVYLVCDGREYEKKVKNIASNFDAKKIRLVVLPDNVGGGGYYGHRIYAGFSYLVNDEYVLYLDEDNWLENNHVRTLIETIVDKNLEWAYSLRKICSEDGDFLVEDNCESLGKWHGINGERHVDTSCFCLRREVAVEIAGSWYGGWGQDRVVFETLMKKFNRFDCSFEYSLNYRLGGKNSFVNADFFRRGNQKVYKDYGGKLPWSNK